MNKNNLTFEQYKQRVEHELMRKYLITVDDCTDNETIESSYNNGETIDEFIEWIGSKHDLEDVTTYPHQTPRKYVDKEVELILERKEAGIDCIEEESAAIKQFVKTELIQVGNGSVQIVEKIQNLFPIEYGEALDEMENKKKFELGTLQKAWVQSLKDNPQRQNSGQLGFLVDEEKGDYKACCLGEFKMVDYRLNNCENPFKLVTLFDAEDNKKDMHYLYHSFTKYGLIDWRGKIVDGWHYKDNIFDNLAEANDCGVSWAEIAEFIENNAERVFTKSV